MSNDPLDIEAPEKAEQDREEKLRLTQRREADDFKWLMADPRGRRVMWHLLSLAGVYQSSFTGNSETFFREGRRSMGLKIVDLIHTHCPDKYATMTKEAIDDRPTNAD